MSYSQPTGGTEAVALDLPDPQRKILRSTLTSCLEGISGDLKQSARLAEPERAQREAGAYRRLLAALGAGEIALPDEAAREAVEAMALAIEEDTDYRQLIAEHDALFGLLDLSRRRQSGGVLMDIAARFGDNLVRCRKQAHLSQDELSVRASVHRTEISQLERGLRVARIDTLVKISGSLEVDPRELLAGIVWSPGDVRRGRFQSSGDDGER